MDDIKMNLKLAETVLHNRMSCETLLAGSGRECLTVLAEREDIDLILLDIAMPELDGMQTLKLIRKVDRLKHIPVMFLTADGDPLTVIKANEFHAIFTATAITPPVWRTTGRTMARVGDSAISTL